MIMLKFWPKSIKKLEDKIKTSDQVQKGPCVKVATWKIQEANKQDLITNPTKYGRRYKIQTNKRYLTYQ
jgi:hypothetical protein